MYIYIHIYIHVYTHTILTYIHMCIHTGPRAFFGFEKPQAIEQGDGLECNATCRRLGEQFGLGRLVRAQRLPQLCPEGCRGLKSSNQQGLGFGV